MTAFEAHYFTVQELNKIANVEKAIKAGSIKQNELPADFAPYVTAENKAKLVAANKKSHAKLMEELNEWL